MDQDLFALLQNADPETLQSMIDAGLVPERMQIAQQAGTLGQGLASTETPQGRNVGHTYVASSPLEHLSAALRQGAGFGMAGDALKNQQALTGQQGEGRLAYLKLLAGQGQPQPQQTPPPRLGLDPNFT